MFFGRSVTLLLVGLFGLTGLQMVLSQIGQGGAVLGETIAQGQSGLHPGGAVESIRGQSSANQESNTNTTETTQTVDTIQNTTAPPVVVTTVVPTASISIAPTARVTVTVPTPSVTSEPTVSVTVIPAELITAAPARIITPQPSLESASGQSPPAESSSGSTNTSSTTEIRSSTGTVLTTTNAVDRSTNETVRQIVRKIGIQTPASLVKEAPAPDIKQAVKVIEEKTAGEILSELSKSQTPSGDSASRLRYKFVNGVMSLVGETSTGQETNLAASDSAAIVSKLERSAALSVTPGSTGEYIFTKGQVRAATELPLLVDLKTNLLTTETSTGIKTVSLLPDDAIKIAFASKVVDGIYPKKNSAEISFSEAENGRLTYEIDGLSKRKIFGLIPITLKETALVDAGNGTVSQPDKSLGQLFVELVAFPVK